MKTNDILQMNKDALQYDKMYRHAALGIYEMLDASPQLEPLSSLCVLSRLAKAFGMAMAQKYGVSISANDNEFSFRYSKRKNTWVYKGNSKSEGTFEDITGTEPDQADEYSIEMMSEDDDFVLSYAAVSPLTWFIQDEDYYTDEYVDELKESISEENPSFDEDHVQRLAEESAANELYGAYFGDDFDDIYSLNTISSLNSAGECSIYLCLFINYLLPMYRNWKELLPIHTREEIEKNRLVNMLDNVSHRDLIFPLCLQISDTDIDCFGKSHLYQGGGLGIGYSDYVGRTAISPAYAWQQRAINEAVLSLNRKYHFINLKESQQFMPKHIYNKLCEMVK